MNALLLEDYSSSIDPAGWLISEKFDGIRALWDGKRFLSKSGRDLGAPAWFCEGMPETPLDGELWAGRGGFQRVLSAVQGDWQGIEYKVFDAPAHGGTFHQRAAFIITLDLPGQCSPAENTPCVSALHFEAIFEEITSQGGEGIVAKDPDALYLGGYSSRYLRRKAVEEAEAIVTGHNTKPDGTFKSIQVEGQNKASFALRAGLKSVPAVGEIITYEYNGLTDAGNPRGARFKAVRNYE